MSTQTGGVTAGITYTVDTGEKLVNETFAPGNVQRGTTGTYEERQMSIRDARPLAGTLSLAQLLSRLDAAIFSVRLRATRSPDFFLKLV